MEGFFSPDGVMLGHMFLLNTERSAIVGETVAYVSIPVLCKCSFLCLQFPPNQQDLSNVGGVIAGSR